MKSTLKLNDSWDIALDSAGNLAISNDDLAPCQDACSYARTWAGEVMFNQSLGIPYGSAVLVANPDLHLYKEMLAECGAEVDGVVQSTAQLGRVGERRDLTGLLIIKLTNNNTYYINV